MTLHWNCGQTAADSAKVCIQYFLQVGANPSPLHTPLTPKIGDLNTPPLNSDKTEADGAAL